MRELLPFIHLVCIIYVYELIHTEGAQQTPSNNNNNTFQTIQPLPYFPYVQNITNSPLSVRRGYSVDLFCRGQGSPKPTVRWFKDGQRLHDHMDNNFSILQLTDVQYSDEGLYDCVVSNHVGNSSRQVHLGVYGEPTIVDTSGNVLGTEEGQPFHIFCYEEGIPLSSVSWNKNGANLLPRNGLSFTENGRVLNIQSAVRADSGDYECEFKNQHGKTSDIIEVIVGTHPSIIWHSKRNQVAVEGSRVIFYCSGNGYPKPDIAWRKGNTNLSQTNGVRFSDDLRIMDILNVSQADSGSYSCTYFNAIGSEEKKIDLNVRATGTVQWLTWGEWQCPTCQTSCGGDIQYCRRQRTCIGTPSLPGVCIGVQEAIKFANCSDPCAGNPAWTSWGSWNCGACSASCGGGSQTCTRNRICQNINTAQQGIQCNGPDIDYRNIDCNINSCTTGVVMAGSRQDVWVSTRNRICQNINTAQQGIQCNGPDIDYRNIDCNINSCTTGFSTSSTTISSKGGNSASSVGLIAGAAGGGLAVLLVVVIVICLVRRRPKQELPVDKSTSTVTNNKDRTFNQRSRRESGVYEQIQNAGRTDENIYSTIDDYGKYTEIQDIPEERPKYLELIGGVAVYGDKGITNAGYRLDDADKNIRGAKYIANELPQNPQQSPINHQSNENDRGHMYHVLEKI